MKCYVCDRSAHVGETTRDAKCATCKTCGSYLVSGSLLAEKTHQQAFVRRRQDAGLAGWAMSPRCGYSVNSHNQRFLGCRTRGRHL
jgi:hypothetical protein